eukprot:m.83788 g.83788  ORF g.83788 m.83788 type:complete len:392 (+) comp12935_c0_seq5:199-1374(+)
MRAVSVSWRYGIPSIRIHMLNSKHNDNALQGRTILRRFSSLHQKLPTQMRAVVLPSPGSVEQLILRDDVPVKKPAGEEVCIQVDACAVSYRDILDRQGAFPFIMPNAIIGHEIAGTVVAGGSESSQFKPGTRVVSLHWAQDEAWPSPLTRKGSVSTMLGLATPGGYAEYCTVHQSAFVEVPEGWTSIDASPVMSTFGTIWQGAKIRGRLQAGETVVVTGATGGVGASSVLIAKKLGCKVIAVSTSRQKKEFLESLEPDDIIFTSSESPDFHKQVQKQGGAEMVIECTGGPTFSSSIRSLRPEGRLVLVGNVSNAQAPLPLGLCILNSLQVIGSDSIHADSLRELFKFMGSTLRPNIQKVLSLDNVKEAHRMLESKQVCGRVVLQVSEDTWQ